MVRTHEPGSPLPFGLATSKPDMVVIEAGDFDKDDGIKVVLSRNHLVFMGAFDGTNVTLGIEVTDLLDAIQKHTHEQES